MSQSVSLCGVKALAHDSRVYVAGHRGLVGSAMWRHLDSAGFTDLVGRQHQDLDLRDRGATQRSFDEEIPSS